MEETKLSIDTPESDGASLVEKPSDAQQPTNNNNNLAEKSESVEQTSDDPVPANANGTNDGLERKIIEQVEYYFGDINLPRDRFLQDEMKKDDGWVSLETMLKFNRLAKLSTDQAVIASALKQSKLINVSEDGTKIRRNPEKTVPQNSLEYWQVVKQRTAYVKGFDQNASLDEILEFMKLFGTVEHVMFRRDKSAQRRFKGSIFVTFKTQELAEAFVSNDTKEFKGNELLKMMQNDYWAQKQKRYKEQRLATRLAKQAKKAADIQEQTKSHEAVHFVKGLVLSVENIPKEDCDLMKVKDFFKQFGDVQYVVYESGDDKAQIRFNGAENGAVEAWEKALKTGDGKVILGENELKGAVLEGEEEEKYWNEFSISKANKQKRMQKNRRSKSGRGRGRGRGGGGNNQSRGQKRSAESNGDDGAGEKKPKKTVFEDE